MQKFWESRWVYYACVIKQLTWGWECVGYILKGVLKDLGELETKTELDFRKNNWTCLSGNLIGQWMPTSEFSAAQVKMSLTFACQTKSHLWKLIHFLLCWGCWNSVGQGFSTLALKVHFPAEFTSNPNQTGMWTSRAKVENPCCRV